MGEAEASLVGAGTDGGEVDIVPGMAEAEEEAGVLKDPGEIGVRSFVEAEGRGAEIAKLAEDIVAAPFAMAELREGALREDLPGRAGNDEGTRVGAAAEGEAGRRVGAADVPALDGLTVDDARDGVAVADQDANLGEGLVEEAESPGDEEGLPVSISRPSSMPLLLGWWL
jgi:hypothetical protein